jgi:PAS domain S-box-containing protein
MSINATDPGAPDHPIAHGQVSEDRLREQRTLLANVIEGTGAGTWQWNIRTGQAEINARWAEMVGYTLEELAPISFQTWIDLVHPDDLPISDAAREAYFAGTVTYYDCEVRMRHKNGSWIWIHDRGKVVERAPGGAPLLMAGIHIDITERRIAEEKFNRAERLLHEAQETAQIGYYVNDLATGLWESSPTLDKLFGIGPHFVRDTAGWGSLMHPDDREPTVSYFLRIIANKEPFRRDYRIIRPSDGQLRWMAGYGNFEYDNAGNAVRLVGCIQDITERKQAEQILRDSETRTRHEAALLRSIMESPHGVIIFSLDCGYRYTEFTHSHKATMQRIWGVDIQIGMNMLEVIHDPADRAKAKSCFDRALGGESLVLIEEYGDPARHRTFYEDRYTPMFDVDGTIIGLTVFVIDVTERKQLEDKLRQAQKMEAIGQLAGGVAHDFNNILAAIMMQLGLLRHGSSLDLESREALKELELAAKRAAGVTRQLLMFSRRSVMEIKVLDLNEVVEHLLKMLRRLIGDHIELRFDRASAPLWVEADAGMLEQVLMNLCVNARDAMPRGGRLIIGTALATVTDQQVALNRAAPGEHCVCLRVSDTGCGMDECTLQQVFEPFFTTKAAGHGTGLGLATVHGIIAQHRGWVEVSSTVGQGSTFSAYLPSPLKGPDLTLVTGPAATPSLQDFSGHEHILLVEDEPGVREVIARLLRLYGYTVHEAGNGLEALAHWKGKRDHIALLFTDMMMPGGINGLELTAQFRTEKPELKVIISSGYSREIVDHDPRAAEGVLYLPKPCDALTVGKAIRSALDSVRN